MNHRADFLVLGSGISGLLTALKLSSLGEVIVATKKEAAESNTNYAQGGVAAVLGEGDSFDSHAADTLAAGAGLCDEAVVRMTVSEAPERIRELKQIGVQFSPDLGLEAAHSHRRIVHAGDITGREIERGLLAACRKNPRIRILEHHLAISLIKDETGRAAGAYIMDAKAGAIHAFCAKAVILATGGAGKAYIYTSNPDIASGDGLALAYRAGATLANLEFVQFHPTCLYHPKAKSFLLSEALRGEGGKLRLKDGTAFMRKYSPQEELAPRDVVARAIDAELKRTGDECVFLDMTHKPADFLRSRFPNICEQVLSFGIDMTRQPIPVVPAAHFFCGGVRTDQDGATDLPGLFAVGEAACTGLHGANRLASNSLLEGCVFAHRVFLKLKSQAEELSALSFASPPPWNAGKATPVDEAVMISHNWDEIRRLMWNYVGIVRSNKRLERALRRMELLNAEIEQYYWDFILTPDLVELRNLAVVATLVIKCAMARQESRGLHYNLDYPQALESERHDTLIVRQSPSSPRRLGSPAGQIV